MVRSNNGLKNTEEYVRYVIEKYAPNVEYVGGYTGRNNRINVRCRCCGEEFSTSYHYIAHKKKSVRCPNCFAIKQQKRLHDKELRRLKRNAKVGTQLSFRICERCGTIFIPKTKQSRYCSESCRKAINRHGNADDRLCSKNVIDWNITLTKLSNKCDGICWICNESVDWNDYIMRDDVFIAGDMYPSIDHIIPLSKGGKHSWDNVALAHRICNSRKSDKILK